MSAFLTFAAFVGLVYFMFFRRQAEFGNIIPAAARELRKPGRRLIAVAKLVVVLAIPCVAWEVLQVIAWSCAGSCGQ